MSVTGRDLVDCCSVDKCTLSGSSSIVDSSFDAFLVTTSVEVDAQGQSI